MLVLFLLAALGAPAAAAAAAATRDEPARLPGYFNPSFGGGSNLAHFPWNFTGLGEPLNIIVSGQSAPQLLTPKGFFKWAEHMGYGKECFGLHDGLKQQADLGDGRGWLDQQLELRWLYGNNPVLGACDETFRGGSHFRGYQQAETNAWFLSVSNELNLFTNHRIEPDGYDHGRDKLVSAAQKHKRYNGGKYTTHVKYITGWLPTGNPDLHHDVAIDGRTAVLTIVETQ